MVSGHTLGRLKGKLREGASPQSSPTSDAARLAWRVQFLAKTEAPPAGGGRCGTVTKCERDLQAGLADPSIGAQAARVSLSDGVTFGGGVWSNDGF